jgi:hypothetical protein
LKKKSKYYGKNASKTDKSASMGQTNLSKNYSGKFCDEYEKTIT